MPDLTVLVVTYNHEGYIAQAVSSALVQQGVDVEVLVYDHASSDQTARVAASIADPRVTIVSARQNVGVQRLAIAYNEALLYAHAPILCILEGDDWLAPNILRYLVAEFARPEVVIAYGLTIQVDSAGQQLGIVTPSPRVLRRFGEGALVNRPVGAATRAMLHFDGQMFVGWSGVAIRRAALLTAGGFASFPGLPATDYPTVLSLSLLGEFAFLQRPAAYWRRHPGSNSWRYRRAFYTAAPQLRKAFLDRHSVVLGLSKTERSSLERTWAGRHQFNEGRALLLEGNWAEAARWFWQSLRRGGFQVRVAAAIGLLAAALHRDVEPVIRITGRPTRGRLRAAVKSWSDSPEL